MKGRKNKAPTRRRLNEDGSSSGCPTTRDDDREMARGVRDETGRERDDGDHGYDPRRREGALKPEKERNINVRQENERRKAKNLKRKQEFKYEKSRKQKNKTKCERQAKT